MPYITQPQIEALIPPQKLADALDDDGDNQADPGLLDAIIANESNAVDALLQGRYPTPFAVPPALVVRAALVFTCEAIYRRREIPGDRNPFSAEAAKLREQLTRIASRELPLDAAEMEDIQPGAIIREEAPLNTSLR